MSNTFYQVICIKNHVREIELNIFKTLGEALMYKFSVLRKWFRNEGDVYYFNCPISDYNSKIKKLDTNEFSYRVDYNDMHFRGGDGITQITCDVLKINPENWKRNIVYNV